MLKKQSLPKKKNIIILLSLILVTLNCQSNQTSIAINKANLVCTGSFESTGYTLEIPPEAVAPDSEIFKYRGLEYVRTSRYNAVVIHARDLSGCVEAQNCVARKLGWEYSCALEAEKNIHLWIPYAFQSKKECSLEEPKCRFLD